jgi:hypothetical protein
MNQSIRRHNMMKADAFMRVENLLDMECEPIPGSSNKKNWIQTMASKVGPIILGSRRELATA